MAEYAKFVRVRTTQTSRGVRATIQLPGSKTFINNNPGDYINTYLGFGSFEAGISVRAPESLWGWFINTPEGNGPATTFQYANGSVKQVALYIAADGHVVFEVDGVQKYRSAQTYSSIAGSQTPSGRFVTAAAQVTDASTGFTAPWRIFHDQVTVSSMQYLNASSAWQAITTVTATQEVFHTPTSPTPPAPVDYTSQFDLANSRYYASLK